MTRTTLLLATILLAACEANEQAGGGDGAGGDDGAGANGSGANGAGANGAGGDDGAGGGEPSPPEVPPVYPQDGYCSDSGVAWAWCEDFDGQGVDSPAAFDPATSLIDYHQHSHVTIGHVTCESTLVDGADCAPYVQGGSLFLNAEDSGFGMDVLRVEQPFDFEGREGRIHYRSNMKGHGRMHQAVHISPATSNTLPDLRDLDPAADMGPSISITFVGDGGWPFGIVLWNQGEVVEEHHVNGPLGIELNSGADLFDVDLYLSRTHLRVHLDGQEVFSEDIADLGFDLGYVYFSQLAYNPVKDGYEGEVANRFLWDDLAFDGPSLARNSLTPPGKQDVLFRAWNMASCTVRGVVAEGPPNPEESFYLVHTWHARLDDTGSPVTLSDIQCNALDDFPAPEAAIADIEIVTP